MDDASLLVSDNNLRRFPKVLGGTSALAARPMPLKLPITPPQIVGDHFGVGIDDTHVKLRGAPVLDEAALDAHQKMIADKLSVAELMTAGVTALPPLLPVAHLLEVLRSCSHQVGPAPLALALRAQARDDRECLG